MKGILIFGVTTAAAYFFMRTGHSGQPLESYEHIYASKDIIFLSGSSPGKGEAQLKALLASEHYSSIYVSDERIE